jgi:uncharacterized repeat protein (TIGR03803 family)
MTRTEAQLTYSKTPRSPLAASSTLWPVIQFFLLLWATASAQAQTLTVLHAFTGKGDGVEPSAGLVRDSHGNLFGTTMRGGSFHEGTIFEVNAKGKETILHSFWGGDGWDLSGTLIRDHSGVLYGNASAGGTPEGGGCAGHGCGAVFKLDPKGHETTLYAFRGKADGWAPDGNLVRDKAGNLYGAAAGGGDQGNGCDPLGCGVIFEVDNKGQQKVRHAFTGPPDGKGPSGGLVRDQSGNLYGVTLYGGSPGWGTVFKVDAKGNETVLYSFNGGADGLWPGGRLVLDSEGNLYGAAGGGGSARCCGVVFKVDTAGRETVLHTFTGGSDGRWPQSVMLRDTAGNLYGVTYDGGSGTCFGYGCGVVFKLDSKGNETVLYSFTGGKDGGLPTGDLLTDSAGNLYGTTSEGGDLSCAKGSGCGVVFKLTP